MQELWEHTGDPRGPCGVCRMPYGLHRPLPLGENRPLPLGENRPLPPTEQPLWATLLAIGYVAAHLAHTVHLYGGCTDRHSIFAEIHCVRLFAMFTLPYVSIPDTLLFWVTPGLPAFATACVAWVMNS